MRGRVSGCANEAAPRSHRRKWFRACSVAVEPRPCWESHNGNKEESSLFILCFTLLALMHGAEGCYHRGTVRHTSGSVPRPAGWAVR
ncbi:hypothetical protein EYF80_044262 [Liparis tanakae]|uniref:Uncharacterized protein n=1 Tax=Liparis tanakae TaxID=230148 RepID=A0A4Z2FWB0_9TELE|nr:hypothetical protein EYF80_044262 [Liparis tanakae]